MQKPDWELQPHIKGRGSRLNLQTRLLTACLFGVEDKAGGKVGLLQKKGVPYPHRKC